MKKDLVIVVNCARIKKTRSHAFYTGILIKQKKLETFFR
jgi:hypothetical protein